MVFFSSALDHMMLTYQGSVGAAWRPLVDNVLSFMLAGARTVLATRYLTAGRVAGKSTTKQVLGER